MQPERAESASKAMPIAPKRVTSDVYPRPREWWELSLLYPHEVIRRLLEQAENIAAKLDPVTKPWQAEIFVKWYTRSFERFISSHHDVEEGIYFPWIETKAILPERLAADHEELMAVLNAVHLLLEPLKSEEKAVAAAAAEEIARLLRAIAEDMRPHLSEEESMTQTVLRDNFTAQEEIDMKKQIVRHKQHIGANFELTATYDAALEWMTEEQLQTFFSYMAPKVRFLLVHSWHPAFLRNEKRWALELLAEDNPNPASAGCWGGSAGRGGSAPAWGLPDTVATL